MRLNIELPDEIYEYIKTNYKFKDVQDQSFVIAAIANGIVLTDMSEQERWQRGL